MWIGRLAKAMCLFAILSTSEIPQLAWVSAELFRKSPKRDSIADCLHICCCKVQNCFRRQPFHGVCTGTTQSPARLVIPKTTKHIHHQRRQLQKSALDSRKFFEWKLCTKGNHTQELVTWCAVKIHTGNSRQLHVQIGMPFANIKWSNAQSCRISQFPNDMIWTKKHTQWRESTAVCSVTKQIELQRLNICPCTNQGLKTQTNF